MMTPNELKLKISALEHFERVVATYDKMSNIHSMDLYFNGHASIRYSNMTDETIRVVRQALVAHAWDKVILEASNLRTHGVDPTPLMPKGSK